MDGSLQEFWSSSPNAPELTSDSYSDEKANLFGVLTSTMLYGVVILLFFRCMRVLFSPVNRTTKSIKWLLVSHTIAMFSFTTILTAINLDILSDGYVGNREFTYSDDSLPPGPLGYKYLTYSKAIGVATSLSFLMNNWLADGLLLYRCYVIYSMKYRVVSLPCLLYLASFAMGALLIHKQATELSCTIWHVSGISVGIQYSISVALNLLLTAMIITRLLLLRRDIQEAMNAPVRISGLYRAVIAMLSESCAIYTLTFLLFVGAWAANSPAQYFFFPALGQFQTIAPFLIILRVADRRESASETVTGGTNSTHLSLGNLTSNRPPSCLYPPGSMNTEGKSSGGFTEVAASSILTKSRRSSLDL